MNEAEIVPRKGLSEDEVVAIAARPPHAAPDLWLTRDEAAEFLGVGPRTVDRYIRARELTTYKGRVPEGGVGVRIVAADVQGWADRAYSVKVVAPDGE